MNLQLQESSIKGLLKSTGFQEAKGRVRSESLQEEMSLIGFLPFSVFYSNYDLSFNIDLNNHLIVTPYYIRFSKDSAIFPIFTSIAFAEGKRFILHKHLLLDHIIDEMPDLIAKQYESKNRPLNGKILLNIIKRWKNENLFEKNEDGTLFYIGRSKEWEMKRSLDDWNCVTNDFLCLCSYMNKITGLPSYTVLMSDDVIRILSEDK